METQEISAEKLLNMLEEKDRKIAKLEQQVQWLMSQIRLAKHKQFGASSERTDEAQLSIFNEAELGSDMTMPEPDLTEVKTHYRKRTRLTTDKLPKDLPVEIIEHELPAEDCICPECNGKMHTMGKEIREELKIIPARAVIVRHIQHVYACRNCETTSDHVPILKANIPEPVIKGGFASPETIAHIAVQKFMMASPLYRQEQEWKQNGILLSRQTMSNWLIKACEDWLEPVYEEMKRRLCAHEVLHADETTLQVLKEPEKAAQSKSYMWLYRTSGEAKHQLVLYDYQPDRKRIRPEAFLKNFKGYLHTDGYQGYHRLPKDIIVVGCLAHLRRKFFDAFKTLPKEKQAESNAAIGVAYCDRLFHFEKQFALLSPEKRHKEREQLSRPLFDQFYQWIKGTAALPNTLLGKAIHYAKSQRRYLERYLLDGRLEISNNRAERSIKPFVIGRKNWLFSNTPKGARASAIYYSLIVSAGENGLNPFEYLTWIFTHAPNLGRAGYITSVTDFLPGSAAIPEKILTPQPGNPSPKKFAWEEN
ncbi:MAG: IS66 family transposase [Desulfotomaculaceae bacterium]|nr:IS66 family transposase [Desulfotomaculaceae bacterium]